MEESMPHFPHSSHEENEMECLPTKQTTSINGYISKPPQWLCIPFVIALLAYYRRVQVKGTLTFPEWQ